MCVDAMADSYRKQVLAQRLNDLYKEFDRRPTDALQAEIAALKRELRLLEYGD
mgnify:CR=1 FL=1